MLRPSEFDRHAPVRSGPRARPARGSLRAGAARLRVAGWVKLGVLAAAVGVGSLALVHPDPYSLTAATRWARGAGLTGYPVHFSAYCSLALLAAVLRPRLGRRANDAAWAARLDAAAWPVFLAFHGVGTECLQAFVPTRTPDALDAACNLCGVAAGWTLGNARVRARLTAAAATVGPRSA